MLLMMTCCCCCYMLEVDVQLFGVPDWTALCTNNTYVSCCCEVQRATVLVECVHVRMHSWS